MSETPIGWIREVVLDSPDPWALARFWAGLLGGTPVEWYPGWVTLEPPPHGQRLSFQRTGTPLAEDTARIHFDILVENLAAAHARVVTDALRRARIRTICTTRTVSTARTGTWYSLQGTGTWYSLQGSRTHATSRRSALRIRGTGGITRHTRAKPAP